MPALQFYSAERVRSFPEDGNRYETVHGELLVTPAPRVMHQAVVFRLAHALSTYLAHEPIGIVLGSPADISWAPDSLVQPDLFVAPRDEIRTLRWDQVRTLLVVVEILSPSSVRADRFTKRRLYQEAGVPLYWVLNPEAGQAEVWRPDSTFPEPVVEALTWIPKGASSGFHLLLEELFRSL